MLEKGCDVFKVEYLLGIVLTSVKRSKIVMIILCVQVFSKSQHLYQIFLARC